MVPLPPSQARLEDRLISGKSMVDDYLVSEWPDFAAN